MRHIVGVNRYADKTPVTIPILEMNPLGYQIQVNRLAEVRRTRDNGAVGQALDRLRLACQSTQNTMPYLMEAVHTYATLGEIVDVMRAAFGTYEEPTWI
jgi:methylmalonyl-CoA mutase N-terminal domain/subunit